MNQNVRTVEQRTDEYRKDVYRRMGMIAERLLAGQEYLRGDEHLSFMLWRDLLDLPADIGLSEAAKFIPIEFADGGDVPEDEISGLRRTLDEYLMKLSDKLVANGAKDYLLPFGIPLDKYEAAITIHSITAEIEYVHRDTGARIILDEVYFSEFTGEVLQVVFNLRLS